MKRLFIAEKPSIAKALAGELGVTAKGEGFIECGEDTVTWCFGHMLEQAGPDEYTPDYVPTNDQGSKIWRVDELPIIPQKWILKPTDDAKKQLKIIGKLLKVTDKVVHAGDKDREGQLLVDEVLEYFGNAKPVVRYIASSNDSITIQRALADMKSNDNKEYRGLHDAALGRRRADWLVGMNLSRAYTLRAQRGGSRALLTVGRVQTPTLAIVVNTDRQIENFKPIPFHTIKAEIQHPKGSFWANWKAKEDQAGLDSEGRLVDTAIANSLIESLKGKEGEISEYKQEPKKQKHPLTFSLSEMTILASKQFGYTAEEVLKTCQSLYETHKLTTYPRTDCTYLPESQFSDAPAIMSAIKATNPTMSALVDGADTSIKSRTWDDKKVTAHHGIIPTFHKGDLTKLNEKERNIYDLVVRSYVAQFYPLHEFMSTSISVEVEGENFSAKGKVVTKSGWHEVYRENAEEDEAGEDEDKQTLPKMNTGDAITCSQALKRDAKTKPPARLTEGTLIKAMINIHRYETDPQLKKILRDEDGIGTEATRASILSELKRRKYLEVKGRHIVSTTLGRSMIDALPDKVTSPVLTSLYERVLKSVESGSADIEGFLAKQEAFIKDQVAKANDGAVKIEGGEEAAPISDIYKCMSCGAGLQRRPLPKKKGHFWWGCSNYPTCKQTYPDVKARPNYNKGRNAEEKANV